MIKAIFFDLHEVITHGDFRDIYKTFAHRAGLPHTLVANFYRENLSGLLTGAVTTADELQHYGIANMSEDELLQLWSEVILEEMTVDEKMLQLLTQLRKNYDLVTVTNLTPSRLGPDLAMGLYDYFDRHVLSYQDNCRKPDAAIYQLALERAGVTPNEAIFIDDQQKNVDAAVALGIHGIQFSSYEQLCSELTALGVEGITQPDQRS